MELSFEAIKQSFTSNFNAYLDSFFYQLQNPAWDNPYYMLLTIYGITFMLEVILPKKERFPLLKRKGFKLDLMYLLFIDFVIMAIGFYAMTGVVEMLFLGSLEKADITVPVVDVGVLPVIVQFLIFFVVADFVQFLGHYLLHRIDFLWAFHKIHHAQEDLGFASTRRFHWVEYLVFKPLFYIPFGLMGYASKHYVIYYFWGAFFFTFLSHCNIKLKWGFWNYVVINPDTHYWHHAKNIPGRYGVNFASVLNIWDLLFGTFYLPKGKKPVLGVPDIKEVPQTFMGQMVYPFKALFKKQKAPQGVPEVVQPVNTGPKNNRKQKRRKKKV